MKKKIISLYTASGDIAATARYRVFQYMDNPEYVFVKRKMIPEWMYAKWMPISMQSLLVKVVAMLILYFRRLFDLSSDYIRPPEIIILSRNLLPRHTPKSFIWILEHTIKRGTKLVWDFDDNIIANGACSQHAFDKIGELASKIIVASDDNVRLLKKDQKNKTIVLPTTDKELYPYFNEDLINKRLNSLQDSINLIWLGTAVGLPFIADIIPYIDEFAKAEQRRVVLSVVCNKSLLAETSYMQIKNVKWSKESALEELKKAHIGLMPLPDNEITRGKGGFKLIQYLSIGLPIIGSPVGINKDIIIDSVGSVADIDNAKEWKQAIHRICDSHEVYYQYAINSYKHWNTNFSFSTNKQEWNCIIESLLTI